MDDSSAFPQDQEAPRVLVRIQAYYYPLRKAGWGLERQLSLVRACIVNISSSVDTPCRN